MESSVNKDLLRSRVDTFVLKTLSEKDGYGYDILRYIEEKTQGHYNMKQSSVYSVLKRLEKQGLISSYMGEKSKGGPRRYYSLTDEGRKMLDQEKKQWVYTRTLLDNLVSNSAFDLEEDSPPFRPSELRPLTRRQPRVTEKDINQESKEQDAPKSKDNKAMDELKQEYINKFEELKLKKLKLEQLEQETAEKQLNQKAKQTLFNKAVPEQSSTPPYVPKEEKLINPEYKNIFGEIYKLDDKQRPTADPKQIPAFEDEEINCHHINDLKNILKNEGYTLRSYKNDEMLGVSERNLIYSNKLFLHTSILTFLLYVLIVLIIYRFRVQFNYSASALLIIGLCGIIIPFVGLIKFLIEPKRRQRALFNFKIAFAYSIMIFLLVFVINIIICLVTPTINLTIKDLQTYVPIFVASIVPIAVIFYQLLYKSNIYKVRFL